MSVQAERKAITESYDKVRVLEGPGKALPLV